MKLENKLITPLMYSQLYQQLALLRIFSAAVKPHEAFPDCFLNHSQLKCCCFYFKRQPMSPDEAQDEIRDNWKLCDHITNRGKREQD